MTQLRWSTAGESHGPVLLAMVEGIPAGLPLAAEDIDADLARRQRGYGRSARQKIEFDQVHFLGGVRGGQTTGAPLALEIQNRDFASHAPRMSPLPFESPPEALTQPRPGHADLSGGLKYDLHDLRDVLERASARETAARVLVGAVCRKLLGACGIEIGAHVVGIQTVSAPHWVEQLLDLQTWRASVERARTSDVGCADEKAALLMHAAIREAAHVGTTLGGVFEVCAMGVPPGLGSYAQWDRRLDGRLARALMSIPAIKGVEIGLGFEASRLSGHEVQDSIDYDAGARSFSRPSNRAGGIEGGVSNGMPILCRTAMKPLPTLQKAPLSSIDILSKQTVDAAYERSDICAVPAASVVGEAMVAVVLAEALLEKFGGDSLGELCRNLSGYRAQLKTY